MMRKVDRDRDRDERRGGFGDRDRGFDRGDRDRGDRGGRGGGFDRDRDRGPRPPRDEPATETVASEEE